MKSLQEIWDRISTVETLVASQEQIIRNLQTQQSLLFAASGLELPWKITTVDATGNTGRFPSMVIDSAGHPLISYGSPSPIAVKFASFDGSSWQTSFIDSNVDVSPESSISIASNGVVAVAYGTLDASGDPARIRYAEKSGLSWGITDVVQPAAGNGHASPVLAFLSNGDPIIALSESDQVSGGSLRFVRRSGGAWPPPPATVIPSFSGPGPDPDMALGPDGNPSVSFTSDPFHPDGEHPKLGYADFDGTTWTTSIPDNGLEVGWSTSIAFSPAGYPAISYVDGLTDSLKYASFDGTTWLLTVVAGGIPDTTTSLAFDPAGRPAMVYEDGSDLIYTVFDGTSWQSSTIAAFGSDGALAFGLDGFPIVAYYDTQDQDLKVARMGPFVLSP